MAVDAPEALLLMPYWTVPNSGAVAAKLDVGIGILALIGTDVDVAVPSRVTVVPFNQSARGRIEMPVL